jgi:hypothetical protein
MAAPPSAGAPVGAIPRRLLRSQGKQDKAEAMKIEGLTCSPTKQGERREEERNIRNLAMTIGIRSQVVKHTPPQTSLYMFLYVNI